MFGEGQLIYMNLFVGFPIYIYFRDLLRKFITNVPVAIFILILIKLWDTVHNEKAKNNALFVFSQN